MHGVLLAPSGALGGEVRPSGAAEYLATLRGRSLLGRIKEAFARADKLKIVFVGETIIDEYCYVKPLAKPSKEFILATVAVNGPEQFLGGVIAAAKQGEWSQTGVMTITGHEIRKTRYVDGDFSRKLFEVYSSQIIEPDAASRSDFQSRLGRAVYDADVVVVFDFGHGLMGTDERRIVDTAKFLAVNAQSNAGNAGFNPVTKYRHADYVCVDEPEARLAARMQYGSIEDLADEIARRMQCDRVAITRGRHGASVFSYTEGGNKKQDCRNIPAFANHGVDTIGAGDAFLAVSAPLIAAGLDVETAAFVGNVAGAIKVDIVGHRRHVERTDLMREIEVLLK